MLEQFRFKSPQVVYPAGSYGLSYDPFVDMWGAFGPVQQQPQSITISSLIDWRADIVLSGVRPTRSRIEPGALHDSAWWRREPLTAQFLYYYYYYFMSSISDNNNNIKYSE